MSHNLWFLWLIIGLKAPLIGLFTFIFRVMRNQDRAWERGEFNEGWDDHDDDGGGGGGGEPRVKPPAPPGGPSIRRRQPKPRAPRPALRGMPLRRAPRRRAAPLRTHDPRPVPHRTGS